MLSSSSGYQLREYDYDLFRALLLFEANPDLKIGAHPRTYPDWPGHQWPDRDYRYAHYLYLQDSPYMTDSWPSLTYQGREFVKLIKDKDAWDEAVAFCGPQPRFDILEWYLLEQVKGNIISENYRRSYEKDIVAVASTVSEEEMMTGRELVEMMRTAGANAYPSRASDSDITISSKADD